MFVLPLAHTLVRPQRPVQRRLESASSLAQVIDRLLDDGRPTKPTDTARTPSLDVDETDAHYILRFDLPGARKDELTVSIEGRRVRLETGPNQTLESDAKASTEATGPAAQDGASQPAVAATPSDRPRSLYRERGEVRFARTVSLPQEVNSDASEAKLENGVLTLTLAKHRADGARRLTIS